MLPSNNSPSFPPRLPPPPPIDHASRAVVGGTPTASPSAASFPPPPPSRYVPRDINSQGYLSQNHTLSPPSSAGFGGGLLNSPLSPPSLPGTRSPQPQSPMAMRSTSSGMVVEYNPQQWGARGPTGGAYIPHSALASTSRPANPEDGLPSPPPPYTPNPINHPNRSTPPPSSQDASRPPLPYLQSSNPSIASSLNSFASPISAVASPASSLMRNVMSPVTGQPPSFPPPPGQRDRSASRSRSRFGLSALTRGRSNDRSNGSTPDPLVPVPAVIPRPRPNAGSAASSSNRMSVYIQPTQPILEPPASRRSASAGAQMTPNRTHANANWDAAPALPPPPPGPPPTPATTATGQRHHRNGSIQIGDSLVPILSMPTRRPPRRAGATALDTIPPTPAGWVDTFQAAGEQPPVPPLPANIENHAASDASVESSDSSTPERISRRNESSETSAGRGHQRRDSTVKGLRERRSESRARAMSPDGDSAAISVDSIFADLTLNLANSNLNRQGAVKKTRSSMSPKDPPSAGRVQVAPRRGDTGVLSPPNSTTSGVHSAGFASSKALPTPPPTDKAGPSSARAPTEIRQSSAAGKRRATDWSESSGNTSVDSFAKASVERHMTFIDKERAAKTDRERLELFAEYIVMESRLRRDKYSSAFSAMAGDIFELTRDLWRPMQQATPLPTPNSAAQTTGTSTPQPRPTPSRQDSSDSYDGSSPASRANWTPRTESESPSSISSAGPRDNTFRQYQPVLSPIPSMAMSTVPDGPDGEARGRSASRWWESESGSIGGGRQVERTKRESKYMGLHKEARFNLQYEDDRSPALLSTSTPGHGGPSNEYPAEKVGWHESVDQDSLPTPHYSVPSTPSASTGLDVSRLVTLPPPYPRHYPALSNSHPDLSGFRTTIRTMNENSEIGQKKTEYANKVTRQRAVAAQESAARVAQMRHNIQEQVRLGQMTYTDAASAESAFNIREAKDKQSMLRREYDDFQPQVMNPLHALLSEKITKVTASISQLRESIVSSATESSPEAPMEEGDERPELLEKLKLLKWLVEAREMLHRELFTLESERCDRYRDLIVADLTARGEPPSKIQEAQQFFQRDSVDRWCKFEKEARSRLEKLLAMVEEHVNRGVQDQLSAFWDICPGLLEVVKKVPGEGPELARLQVAIPHAEIVENPEYTAHPLQYVHGLLNHAEKATYQYIENQVGLWCLHNEVSVLTMKAGLTVVKAERCLEEGRARDDAELEEEMSELSHYEENSLTSQLKDRVGEVESQWKEALGSDLSACLERVSRMLVETGGWDESLND